MNASLVALLLLVQPMEQDCLFHHFFKPLSHGWKGMTKNNSQLHCEFIRFASVLPLKSEGPLLLFFLCRKASFVDHYFGFVDHHLPFSMLYLQLPNIARVLRSTCLKCRMQEHCSAAFGVRKNK